MGNFNFDWNIFVGVCQIFDFLNYQKMWRCKILRKYLQEIWSSPINFFRYQRKTTLFIFVFIGCIWVLFVTYAELSIVDILSQNRVRVIYNFVKSIKKVIKQSLSSKEFWGCKYQVSEIICQVRAIALKIIFFLLCRIFLFFLCGHKGPPISENAVGKIQNLLGAAAS